ncbi:hypothetical protein BdWA1_001656 [Babesia duncani]|uniref:Uncharacterized protein n=1 Tax=Babesia duncani TaxID=323732 RepID=A0AAD9PKJ8_9APIC|nr:hypothetical protein BdWA1_001656 [Babesia duncani]
MTLIRKSKVLLSGKHFYLGTYRDFSLYEFVAPPRLQHVIEPIEKHIGIRSVKNPECDTVFMHMKDPLASLNRELPHKPIVTIDDLTPEGKVLRGTGMHGPERTDLLRLVLYNRLKVRQMQRMVPSKKESFEDHKLVVCNLWFTVSSTIALGLMYYIGMDYGLYNEHYPWTPPRTDGTRGPGPLYWFTQ